MKTRIALLLGLALLLPLRAWAAVSLDSVSADVAGTGSLTGNMPGTVANDDILVAHTCTNMASTDTFTCPTGWTQLTTSNSYNSANTMRENVCYIVYTGSTPDLAFSWTGSGGGRNRIVAYSGGDIATPVDGQGIVTDNNNVASATLNIGTLTPAVSGDVLDVGWCGYIGAGCAAGGSTAPAGLTNNWDDMCDGAVNGYGSYQALSGTGTTTAYTYTLGNSESHVMGSLAVLVKAPGATPTPAAFRGGATVP